MTELLTAAQMKAIEAAAIASGSVTGLELMERAGRGVVEAVFAEWPELAAGSFRAVVLCGPGNNGGDGFVVARLLKEWGWEVEVFLYGTPEGMPPNARVNYERWVGMGEVKPASEYCDGEVGAFSTDQDLFVDALFGIGLTRPFPVELESFHLLGMNAVVYGYRVVSVDVPSGLCADSGRVLHERQFTEANDWWCIHADLTVTFHTLKLGHVIGAGPEKSGKVVVQSIGL
jgi:ADP-dependent NAD(P)H-hydrate dehydratase / NAD(P)H-hydrate epimerase